MESGVEQRNQPRTKKRCTRKSGVEGSLLESRDVEDTSSSTRLSCICLDLDRTLKHSSIRKYVSEKLEKMARYTGTFRYLCGLFSNYVVIRRLEQDLDPPEIKKVFYDRCWAAINLKIKGAEKTNDLSGLLDEFLQETGLDSSTFPPTVPCRLQETVTREMEISAKNSVILHLESKIKGFLRFRLSNNSEIEFNSLPKQDQISLQKKLLEACLDRDFDPENYTMDAASTLYVDQVRSCLSRAFETDRDKPLLALVKTRPHLFLNLISTISAVAEEASESSVNLRNEANARFGEDKSEGKKSFWESETISRGLVDRPKICTALPIWKLAPCFPYYSTSVVSSVFRKEGFDFSSVSRFMTDHFDLERVKRKGYRPSGFRSDGYQVQVTFMALESQKPLVPGTKNLVKSGYQIPKKIVRLNDHSQSRGLFVLSQGRMDPRKIPSQDVKNYSLTVVDPGCSSVVSVRSCLLEDCGSVRDVVDKSCSWEMKGTEYSERSGRKMLETREKKRRSNYQYGRCFPKFSEVRRKTCSRTSFVKYCRVVAETFSVMTGEKMKRARKRSRFHSSRLVQKTVDSLASRIARGDSSLPDPERKNIVLFGNGCFGAKRGHASVPRKKLVRAISSLTNVGMLDEFRTSKKCPGGCGGDMIDVPGGQRVRQCTTVSVGVENPCPLFSEDGGAFLCDRDRSATLNFCLAGYGGLVHKVWPSHLLRVLR